MALLKSANIPGIDFYEYRDSLYYNKFRYRMKVTIPHIKYVWWCKESADLDDRIQGKGNRYGNVKPKDLPTVVENLDALKTIIDLRNVSDKKIISRIEGNFISFFSDKYDDLKNIQTLLGTSYQCVFTEAQTSVFAGVKLFANEPKHKYRVYLKSKRVDDTIQTKFRELFARQPLLFPSEAFKRWLQPNKTSYMNWLHRFTSASYFIDYDDESTLTYLALMHGELLGKKYKLEKSPVNN
jgi:hypothetical protein